MANYPPPPNWQPGYAPLPRFLPPPIHPYQTSSNAYDARLGFPPPPYIPPPNFNPQMRPPLLPMVANMHMPPPPLQPTLPTDAPPTMFLSPPPLPLVDARPLSQRDQDLNWIRNWLTSRHKPANQPVKSETAKTPNVAHYRASLKLAFELLKELEDVKNSLNNCLSVDDSKWCFLIRRAFRIKEKLTNLGKEVFEPGTVLSLKKKLGAIKKKRARLRLQRQEWRVEKHERQLEARNNTAKIDTWLGKEVEKVEEEKKDKELKEEADSMLGEVRRKIQDIKKTRERLKSLEKLREVRKHKAAQQEAHTTPQQDAELAAKLGQLRALCATQLEQYLAEERTLCVLMESGQEADREQDARRLQALFHSKAARIQQALFGEAYEEVGPEDPLYLFQQFYLQGSKNVSALLNIRRQWDQLLMPPDHPQGSPIPVKWVVPPLPSSPGYGQYLKTQLPKKD